MFTSHEYSFPRGLESQNWFAYSCASHHLTSRASYLHSKKSYSSTCCIRVANGQYLSIRCVSSTYISSSLCSSTSLSLNDILLVPHITISRDNNVVFEFLADKCFVKSQVFRVTLLEAFRDSNGFYCFSYLIVAPSSMSSMSLSNYTILCTNAKFVSCSVISSVNNTGSSLLWHIR